MTAAALCLAINLYWEARASHLLTEWYAIAWVVVNRVTSPAYPDSVCDVIRQQAQFSWTAQHWSPKPDGAPDQRAWQRIKQFAEWFLPAWRDGAAVDPTDGALHYAASSVTPWWATDMSAVTYGGHRFYKVR